MRHSVAVKPYNQRNIEKKSFRDYPFIFPRYPIFEKLSRKDNTEKSSEIDNKLKVSSLIKLKNS